MYIVTVYFINCIHLILIYLTKLILLRLHALKWYFYDFFNDALFSRRLCRYYFQTNKQNRCLYKYINQVFSLWYKQYYE